MRNDKLSRLGQVARLYYEQDQTQNDIAKQLGVSRPLISRMLHEARELGIVEIKIHAPSEVDTTVLSRVMSQYGLSGGALVSESGEDHTTNLAIAEQAVSYLKTINATRLGLGWGHIIGVLVSMLEQRIPASSMLKHVCPMVGNSGVAIRNYHSNENVRIVAQQLKLEPHYLYTPAFAETRQEQELITQTEHYKAVYRQWETMDVALVNIGNYPSTPDFASVARYGSLLCEQRAVGRLLAYYFNEQGEIIRSDRDYAVQIPIPLLARCPNVIGLCSANVGPKALAGALQTGLFHHLIAKEDLVRAILH